MREAKGGFGSFENLRFWVIDIWVVCKASGEIGCGVGLCCLASFFLVFLCFGVGL